MAVIRDTLSTFKLSPFEPVITGSLLYLLTRGPPHLRDPAIEYITSYQHAPQLSTVITSLKWLFSIGVVSKISSLLTRWALNGWRINSGGAPYNWPTEVAVITGGSSGIGAEMVKKLASKGVKVAIVDLQPPLNSKSESPNVKFYKADITVPENVAEVAAKIRKDLGAPSILINNAGIGTANTILTISHKDLEKIFHVNLICHWYTIQEFLPDMIKHKKGHIVTVASMASFTSVAGMVDYCATKAGAMALYEGLTQELKHRYDARFIKVTGVHPSWVQTPLIGGIDKGLPGGIMKADYVAGKVCDNILGEKSGQIILPPALSRLAGLRGWYLWIQEFVRDRMSSVTTQISNE